MSTKFSDKTVNVSYQKFGIHIYDVKLHNDRWYCTVTITSPLEAQYVDEVRLSPDFDCASDDEAIERAKQFAAEWIDHKYF